MILKPNLCIESNLWLFKTILIKNAMNLPFVKLSPVCFKSDAGQWCKTRVQQSGNKSVLKSDDTFQY